MRRAVLSLPILSFLLVALARGEDPPKPASEPVDSYGDSLPKGAVARFGTTRWRHGAPVFAVVFSKDGKSVWSCGLDHSLRRFEATSGKLEMRLDGHSDTNYAVAVSPDGKTVASAGREKAVELWDAASGKDKGELDPQVEGEIHALSYSPDGSVLAAGDTEGKLVLFDAPTGKVRKTLQAGTRALRSLAFSPDGKLLAAGGTDKLVHVFTVSTGEVLKDVEGHESDVTQVAFSPDSKQLASSSNDGKVLVRPVDTFALALTVSGHEDGVNAVAFSPDGKTIASGSSDKTIRLWNAANGALLKKLEGHAGWVNALAFAPSAPAGSESMTLVSGSQDGTLRLWDCSSGKALALPTRLEHRKEVRSIAFSPDGTFFASCDETSAILRELPSGKVLRGLTGEETLAVGLWPGKRLLLARKTELQEHALGSEKLLKQAVGHDSPSAFAFSAAAERIAIGDEEGAVATLALGGSEKRLEPHKQKVSALAFSKDGKLLASGSDDFTARIHDVESGKVLHTFKEHAPSALAFSPPAAAGPETTFLAVASLDKTVLLYKVESGKKLERTFGGHLLGVTSVAFSPDGSMLVSGCEDRIVRVFEVETGKAMKVLEGHDDAVTQVAFSPDGKLIASASADTTVLLWTAPTPP